MYRLHPSPVLRKLFDAAPYQGANPGAARYLFVGLDANYSEDIESSQVFSRLVEYHEAGAAFWQRHRVHHPFLLPGYSGDGRKYHKAFASIGFGPEHAEMVSFVELLHVPTVGRNALRVEDLNPTHLGWINDVILERDPEHIFIPNSVAVLMMATGQFPWLRPLQGRAREVLPLWARFGRKCIYKHLHFSVYGKFERQKQQELAAIRTLLSPQVGLRT